MRIQSSICLLLGLLFLAVTSGVHLFYLVQPTSNLIQQVYKLSTISLDLP
jgi:TM2 domain-containing membrane protein YozV